MDSSVPMLATSPTSRPTSPVLGSTTMAHESTIEELELKMKDLELRFFGRVVPQPELSPFTPHSSLKKWIEQLKESIKATTTMVSANLSPVPLPDFDGCDLKVFLKDFDWAVYRSPPFATTSFTWIFSLLMNLNLLVTL